ncbi:hypothetical protein A1Q1_07138 [Trichosporon asahii var. asahii CBS 2479]|uniref:Uncharacterized protein n=1 Tax=Trichosporon asahii var. asahii (strain ATCC 90039 / CBS 2479 / JCM 2466 / KCTC 7840 / NBRC 103889/ NCYC 2677 / UAMH 7654) TaxID=1186058 RepID=J5TN33_TRIAS|nr:hypothetical protein A1Q1_07138 [Trichosporon asahii var. asahii CBS 2479]EJT51726.1 hypothetical protein A1Q1_07138 [Trichosporon asahii var. asahii CBS 2479]
MTAIFDQPPTLVASDHSQVSPATTAIESPRDYRRSSMLSDSSALYSSYASSSNSLGPATPENASFPYDHRRSFAAERDAKDRASDNHAPSFPFSSSLDNHSPSTLPYPINVGMSYPYSNGLHSTVPRQPTVARSATSDSLPSYQPHLSSSLHTGARPLVPNAHFAISMHSPASSSTAGGLHPRCGVSPFRSRLRGHSFEGIEGLPGTRAGTACTASQRRGCVLLPKQCVRHACSGVCEACEG